MVSLCLASNPVTLIHVNGMVVGSVRQVAYSIDNARFVRTCQSKNMILRHWSEAKWFRRCEEV